MPIYEYHCQKCGHEFEVLQKHFDVDEVPCERCGGPAKRMISNTTFVLKGTGWYVTDYKSGGASCPDSGSHKPHNQPAAKAEGGASSCASGSCQSCSGAAKSPASSGATAS